MDIKVSWAEFDTAGAPVDVRVGWAEWDTAAQPCNVQVSWAEWDTAAQVQGGSGFVLRKSYIKRGKKYLIFDTPEQADAYLALEQAQQAIDKAQHSSRKARQRQRAQVAPRQVVDVDLLAQWIEGLALPVNLPNLIDQQDIEAMLRVQAQAWAAMDEEDVELLLMA